MAARVGERETDDELSDPRNLVPKLVALLPDSRCLGFVEACGDTTFNQIQLPVLIAEIEEALAIAQDPDVTEQTIRRRHASGLDLFHSLYSDIVDGWYVYDARVRPPRLVASREEDRETVVTDREAWEGFGRSK